MVLCKVRQTHSLDKQSWCLAMMMNSFRVYIFLNSHYPAHLYTPLKGLKLVAPVAVPRPQVELFSRIAFCKCGPVTGAGIIVGTTRIEIFLCYISQPTFTSPPTSLPAKITKITCGGGDLYAEYIGSRVTNSFSEDRPWTFLCTLTWQPFLSPKAPRTGQKANGTT